MHQLTTSISNPGFIFLETYNDHCFMNPTKFEKNIFKIQSVVFSDHLEFEIVAMILCYYCFIVDFLSLTDNC